MAKQEEFSVSGKDVANTVKRIIQEGNVRKISIVGKDGKTIAEFPVTLGVVGAALAPVVAAIGVIAALVTECTIRVERR